MGEDIKSIIGSGERILWEGKPDKKCFIFESIFNPLMPFAIIWAIFDFSIIGVGFNQAIQEGEKGLLFVLIPFFALHLMPVWIYLGGVLMTMARYKRTYYVVTDRAVYVSSGVFVKHINTKPFAEMTRIDLHRGVFDQMFNVGDIIATSNQLTQNGKSTTISIASVSNYIDVYNLVKKVQTDIYTDVMYPNAKRPSENPGYNTEYKGL